MPKRYEDDRLYCPTCKKQPTFFREIVRWQANEVDPSGEYRRTAGGQIDYECPQCGGEASWGQDLNP
jgi:endogenous inhibitor of DNA gyrase (YacG/DUF329 family)